VGNLFERLNPGRPPPVEKPSKKLGADPKPLLTDVLTNGPVPATFIQERGAVHGFTRKQLRRAKRQMNIASFKEAGKLNGRWFWALCPPDPANSAPPADRLASG
jgi:hypothetical protein